MIQKMSVLVYKKLVAVSFILNTGIWQARKTSFAEDKQNRARKDNIQILYV